MDIYEYLKKDHEKVSKLFKQFEKTQSINNKKDIVQMVYQELTLHSESEENTFYKELKKFEQIRNDILHSEKEHMEIKQLLKDIINLNADWQTRMLELKQIVEHHVKEEEGKIFDEAKKVLSNKDAWILKEKMHDYKDKLLMVEV